MAASREPVEPPKAERDYGEENIRHSSKEARRSSKSDRMISEVISEEDQEFNPALEKILEERDVVDRLKTLPIWLVSVGIHLVIIILLATHYITDKKKTEMEIISQPNEELGVDMDELIDDQIDVADFEIEVQEADPVVEQPVAVFNSFEMPQDLKLSESYDLSQSEEMIQPVDQMVSNALSGRLNGKSHLLKSGGGNAQSEKAVNDALKWIAAHQQEDGSWDFKNVGANSQASIDSVNAATAMALLPFLGAGHTPSKGSYKETVARGIEFLLSNGVRSSNGLDFTDKAGTMYSQGLVSIVLCEAWAMGEDEKDRRYKSLRNAAQQAVAFIEYAQDPMLGGWRYQPQTKGDTSVAGWQLMALKSGDMGGLSIDPAVMKKALNFLMNQVGYENQSRYGYMNANGGTDATTAIGLLCRLYLDWSPQNPSLIHGADYLLGQGPQFSNPYFIYYATQVFHHIGGERWKKWNGQVRDTLISMQVQSGDDAGSWSPQSDDPNGKPAGRLYVTSLFCMTLEVYYRHMPLYSQNKFGGSAEEAFPID